MSRIRGSQARRALEFIKAFRGEWLTREEVRDDLEWSMVTVVYWVKEFVAQGVLEGRIRRYRAGGDTGADLYEFRLAPQWRPEQEPDERL